MSKALKIAALAATCLVPMALPASADPATTTPIKHLIVVVGENVTFDTLFATYKPNDPYQTVKNLLSEEIINADGTPAHFFARGRQNVGADQNARYSINPQRVSVYSSLPQPLEVGVLNPTTFTTSPGVPDPRYSTSMPPGPYQITNGKVQYSATFSSETGDPVHRFFQMWQQTGGSNAVHDMFLWPAVTVGTGGSNIAPAPTPSNPQQGGELMGFFNMARGDAATFNLLAETYAIADNYHQGMMGGTGANFFMLATGDVAVYKQGGQLATPPSNQIENPDPQPGTANFYKEDGYAGGSYVKCSDATQPGVGVILTYLQSIGRPSNCQPGAYYLVNNYNPPFDIHGNPVLDANNNPIVGPNGPLTTPFTYPPQTVPTIGEALSAKGVSWKWYTGGRDDADITTDPLYAVVRPEFPAGPVGDAIALATLRTAFYNNIGDPLNASANISGTPLHANLVGLTTFYNDVANGTLPSVSFVVPKNLDSGHPGYSASAKYELFIADLLRRVQAQPVWQNTAILVTTDEGGGYFDTGPDQTLDFFGDGSRIPVIMISPHAKKGFVDHTYYDHVSVLKFIERNWAMSPLSSRSRDRLPNPVMQYPQSYLPANAPAIGDLTELFTFGR